MRSNEWRQGTIDRIIEVLTRNNDKFGHIKLSDDNLINLLAFVNNPLENEIIDVYEKTAIDVDLYNTLKDKYPEEFI